MAEVRRGTRMRSFRKGWILISPTRQVVYPAELLETIRTDARGTRTAIFRYSATPRRNLQRGGR